MNRLGGLVAVVCISGAPIGPLGTTWVEATETAPTPVADELPESRLQSIWTAELLDRNPVAARQAYEKLARDETASRESRALASARWIEIDRIRGDRTLVALRELRSLGVVIRGRGPLRLGASGPDFRKAIRDDRAELLQRLRDQVATRVEPENVQIRSAVVTTLSTLATTNDEEVDSLRAELQAAEANGDSGEASRLRRLISNPSLRARVRGPEERVRLLRDLVDGEVEQVLSELKERGLTTRTALSWPRVRRLVERRIQSAMTTAEERDLWRSLGTRLRGVLKDPKADLYRQALSVLVGR